MSHFYAQSSLHELFVKVTYIFITAGSKDHVKAQGEILEGLVARLVNQDSSNHIEKILKEFPPPPADGGMLIDSRNIMSKLLATLTFLVDALMFITYSFS